MDKFTFVKQKLIFVLSILKIRVPLNKYTSPVITRTGILIQTVILICEAFSKSKMSFENATLIYQQKIYKYLRYGDS